MARLTKDAVFTAIEELNKSETDVSVITLHKHLGRGSFSTISKYFNEYRAEHEEAAEQAEQEAVPTIASLGVPAELHKQVIEQAEEQLAVLYANIEQTFLSAKIRIQEESDNKVSEIKEQLEEKTEECNSVIAVSDDQELQIENLESERDMVTAALDKVNQESKAQLARVAELELLLVESNNRNELLETQVTNAQDALSDSKTACALIKQSFEVSQQSLVKLESDLSDSVNSERKLAEENHMLKLKLENAECDIVKEIGRQEASSLELKDLQQKLHDVEIQLTTVTTQNSMYKERENDRKSKVKTK